MHYDGEIGKDLKLCALVIPRVFLAVGIYDDVRNYQRFITVFVLFV